MPNNPGEGLENSECEVLRMNQAPDGGVPQITRLPLGGKLGPGGRLSPTKALLSVNSVESVDSDEADIQMPGGILL